MNKEEQTIINELKEETSKPLEDKENELDTFVLCNIENIKTILNLIDKQQRTINRINEKVEKWEKAEIKLRIVYPEDFVELYKELLEE